MLELSPDPNVAERQIEAIIFYLTTCGYIDSEFDLSEKAFVRKYLRKIVTDRVDARGNLDPEVRFETIEREHEHYVELFQGIDKDVKDLFTEAIADGEDVHQFVHAKLKLRCFEMFKDLSPANRVALLAVVDEFISADGVVHAEEVKFRNELAALLDQDPRVESGTAVPGSIQVREPTDVRAVQDDHPFFKNFEHHYSADPETIRKQIRADLEILEQAEATFERQRQLGRGKLGEAQSVDDLVGVEPFLDAHVYVVPPAGERDYEITVLGDLHGCYSCLKAAVMQSDFINKLRRHRHDPLNNPDVRLVFLGDYIDRGRFSYNGVLRTVIKLFLAAPDHVYMLRGNHEYYIEHQGKVYGGVRPAEAINTLAGHLPGEVFESYLRFFDAMPNMLLFDRAMFVHGGIPRDAELRAKWQGLKTLNDGDLRFQMLWSDPSKAEVIPDDLQAASARFPFGRSQFRSFMSRVGCNLLVRGHEKVNAGFKTVYPDDDVRLFTVFSAGGVANDDIPEESNYRDVRPMAVTIRSTGGAVEVIPWPIDYRKYQDPQLNAFFQADPEIEMKA